MKSQSELKLRGNDDDDDDENNDEDRPRLEVDILLVLLDPDDRENRGYPAERKGNRRETELKKHRSCFPRL